MIASCSWIWRGRGTAWPTKTSRQDRKSTRLNSSHLVISYAVFCLKKKKALITFAVATHRCGPGKGARIQASDLGNDGSAGSRMNHTAPGAEPHNSVLLTLLRSLQ